MIKLNNPKKVNKFRFPSWAQNIATERQELCLSTQYLLVRDNGDEKQITPLDYSYTDEKMYLEVEHTNGSHERLLLGGSWIIKSLCIALFLSIFSSVNAQRPSYCDGPVQMGSFVELPVFSSKPHSYYRVQVAKMKNISQARFHKSLIAQYEPCSQMWTVITEKRFYSRDLAEQQKKVLVSYGYKGAFVIEEIGYQ